MMKKGIFVFAVAAFVLSLVCMNTAEAAPKLTITLAHSGATTDARHTGALAIKDYIEKTSNGDVTVNVYPAGQLGDSRSIVESTQNGAVHICIQPPANVTGFSPFVAVVDIPYLFPGDLAKATTVIKSPAGQMTLDSMQENGMVGFSFWMDMFKAFTANKPLRTTDDFKGLKFRVMSSPILIKMIESLGGSALTIDYQETFGALQTGAIDGQEAGIGAGIYNMKFYEVQDYMMITNHILATQLIFGNKAWFDGLDEQTKKLVTDGVKAGEEAYNTRRTAIEDEAIAAIKAAGVEIISLTPEEIQGLADAAGETCAALYVEANGEKAKAIIDKFNEEIEKLK